MADVRSTCCYCGVGCGVIIESDGARITGVRGDPAHPANFGRLCTKGATLHLSARPDLRALHPELRPSRTEPRRRVSWDEALEACAARFAGIIRRHGPDRVAFYISGQLLTEDYYVFNKLAKGLVGTNNIDSNSRLCMSSAVAGYKASLGVDAPPACYEDIDHAGCILIAGSNTAYAHPVVFRRIEDAKARNPSLKLVVVDPRRTPTAAAADLHLAIRPGADIVLFNAMLNVMMREGLLDRGYIERHTEGFEALAAVACHHTPEFAARVCGVPAADIVRAARWFGAHGPALSLYCQGLNQFTHGTLNNSTLINLHLATGQIGRPGAGPFSLTGQPNAMGGRETGGMANLLCAHRDLANPLHRAEIARLWGVKALPGCAGKTAVELFSALRTGEVKAVWIACTNPAQSMPDQRHVREALSAAEFVVLQEAYRNTETAPFADVLLPAASWGEKEGTVTNSERRISRVRAAVPPPGQARPDWEIAADFARRLGRALGRAGADALFRYRSAEDVFDEHRETTRGRDLDITGMSYAVLEAGGPQQWPLPEGQARGRQRLYENGVFPTPTGRACFVVAAHSATAERTGARFPLHLTTGRARDQWHGMSRTGTVARLFSHADEALLSMHADDAVGRGLSNGDLARVSSRRGAIVVRVAISEEMRPGQVFLAMHWGSRFLSSPGVNALTLGDFDPFSFQPELKHAAVQVEKAQLPWRLVAARRLEGDAALEAVSEWQDLLARFSYACLTLLGREESCVVLRAAEARAPAADLLRDLDRVLGFDRARAGLRYDDPARGVSKRIRFEQGRIHAVRLAGEASAYHWLKEALERDAPLTAEQRRWVCAPLAAPPAAGHRRGRILCACLDVSEAEVRHAIGPGATLEALRTSLRCGTQCGSCVPELKQLLAGAARNQSAAA